MDDNFHTMSAMLQLEIGPSSSQNFVHDQNCLENMPHATRSSPIVGYCRPIPLNQNSNTPQVHQPASAMSYEEEPVRRTRSGRPINRRADSPHDDYADASTKKKKRGKASKPRSANPNLTGPLSIITKDMNVPVRDMQAWVNRPLEERRAAVAKKKGYVTRPMNSFMLYRSAYAERTKVWCTANNHQVVSSVSGASWVMEPQSVRDFYNDLSQIERDQHTKAFPEYKFQPAKPGQKRGHTQDVESDGGNASDPEDDWADSHGVRKRRARRVDRSSVETSNRFTASPAPSQFESDYETGPYPYQAVQSVGAPFALPHQMYADMQQNWLHYQTAPPFHPLMYGNVPGMPYHPSQFMQRQHMHHLAPLEEEHSGFIGLPDESFHELGQHTLSQTSQTVHQHTVDIDPVLAQTQFEVRSAAEHAAHPSNPQDFAEMNRTDASPRERGSDSGKQRNNSTTWNAESDFDYFWNQAARLNDISSMEGERRPSDLRSLRSRKGSRSDRSESVSASRTRQ